LMSRVRKQNPMAKVNEWTELPRARGENSKAYGLNAPQVGHLCVARLWLYFFS
jgi:hypothetical protein